MWLLLGSSKRTEQNSEPSVCVFICTLLKLLYRITASPEMKVSLVVCRILFFKFCIWASIFDQVCLVFKYKQQIYEQKFYLCISDSQ